MVLLGVCRVFMGWRRGTRSFMLQCESLHGVSFTRVLCRFSIAIDFRRDIAMILVSGRIMMKLKLFGCK